MLSTVTRLLCLVAIISNTTLAMAQPPAPEGQNEFPPDESGYEAWLRYTDKTHSAHFDDYAQLAKVYSSAPVAALEAPLSEWSQAMRGFIGTDAVQVDAQAEAGVVFTIDAEALQPEAYRITKGEHLHITGGDAMGLLYGAFAVLQGIEREKPLTALTGTSAPKIPIRMLNHWDNRVMDPVHGSIERVKGGLTIFDWTDLSRPNPRYRDYARMLASIGVNGTCLNNVNAEPEILDSETIDGVAALADVFRPWGVKVYLSVNFASPVLLGNLKTADPLSPEVQAWWNDKADEIYAKIPDFGGFIVKADSEGKPGPGSYGRSHVEGSRSIAKALQPHGGLVFWRAFVYGRDISKLTPHERATADRANHATYEFMRYDGQFEDNVILQVKCSAIDFQIWEPVHALFGKMPNTRLALELQLTNEYTGYDMHLAWPGHYYSYLLNSSAASEASATPLADILAGKYGAHRSGAIVGVSNISNARNWFGHLLAGATLHSFGQLAWQPDSAPEAILDAYSTLTFGQAAAPEIAAIIDRSYDTVAKYSMPMGLSYISEFLHHYDPDPWSNHVGAGITSDGIGIDRTVATGSGYAGLYADDFAAQVESPGTTPKKWLLYFHHLPWNYTLPDGSSLIQTLYDSYYQGVEDVAAYRKAWAQLHGKIDLERWAHVYEKLALQEDHAERWRDLVTRYLLETTGIDDAKERFSARSPSPHNRVLTGFWKAVQDYRARVAREAEQINAITEGE